MEPLALPARDWVSELRESHASLMAKTVEFGELLIDCKKACGHGVYLQHLDAAGIDETEARRAVAIATNKVTSNQANWPLLPAAFSTQYEITLMPDTASTQKLVEEGKINPQTTAREVRTLRLGTTRVPGKIPNAVELALGELGDGSVKALFASTSVAASEIAGEGAAVVVVPADIAWSNGFTNLAEKFTAACFANDSRNKVIVLYFATAAEQFAEAFAEVGPVLAPMR
jgi:hypothetical protein